MNAIFILGTGRSGTHHLCRSLLDFKNIEDHRRGKENFKILHSITCNAILNNPIEKTIINYYKKQIDLSFQNKQIFLDQCHPNIHHYNQLNLEFKNSIFLGIDRPTEQIVASMLNHLGTSRWYDRLKNNYFKNIEYPNNFFGLQNKEELYTLPKHILFAKRVIAHKKLNQKLLHNSNFKLINFENFVNNKLDEIHRIFSKNDLDEFGTFLEKEFTNNNVLLKYKDTLSNDQINDIKKLEQDEKS